LQLHFSGIVPHALSAKWIFCLSHYNGVIVFFFHGEHSPAQFRTCSRTSCAKGQWTQQGQFLAENLSAVRILDWTNSQVKKRCSPAACAKSTSALKQWILWTKPLGWFCVNQFADFTNHLYKRLKSAHHIPRNWQRQPGDTLSFATFMELAAGHCILCNIHGIGGRTLLFFYLL
jgi:hypothetical protein